MSERSLIPVERITSAIVLLPGHKVLLDTDLAALYGVEVKALNQAVRRNRERFPTDFMFQLSTEEMAALRSQTVTLKTGRGAHRKYRPYAFIEQGVAMLSEEEMKRLTATLREQQAEARRFDAAIAANLKELGYGA